MAQCFISTYRNHYRWNDPVATPSAKIIEDKFTSVIPPEEIWIEAIKDAHDLNLEEWEKRIHRSCLKRYITTYQISYCKNQLAKLLGDRPAESPEPSSEGFENQLLQGSKDLYEPDSRPKIAPPLPGTRRVFGYIRPSRNYTPLTNYQHFFGKTAYKILKGERKKPAKVPEDASENKEAKPKEIESEETKDGVSCECRCCCKRLK